MNYTKGKWAQLRDTNSSDFTVPLNSIHSEGRYICTMLVTRNIGPTALSEAQANSKLISKVPEMYELLKELYEESVITTGLNVARIVTTPETIIKLESLINETES